MFTIIQYIRNLLPLQKDFYNNNFDHIFVHQISKYDCGRACVQMVLKMKNLFKDEIDFLPDENLTTMWTVDLYYDLRMHNVDCLFCTKFVIVKLNSYFVNK